MRVSSIEGGQGEMKMLRRRAFVLLKILVLMGIVAMLDGCMTGNPPIVTRGWSPPPGGPQPARDHERDGYWWMPGAPPEGVGDDENWGNRGVLFQAYEPKRVEEEPVEIVEVTLPEPPITFVEVPEVAPVEVEEVVVREHIVLENAMFDLDKAELKPEGKFRAREAADYLEKYPSDSIIIEGHTCSLGTEEHNLDLGMRRADAVRRYLIEVGIESERMTVVSYGESRPIADNSTEENRQLNRRAIMEIVEGE